MNKKEGAFHLLTGPSDESVRKQIAYQYDIDHRLVTNRAVIEAFNLLRSSMPLLYADILFETNRFTNASDRARRGEDYQQLTQRAEVLLDADRPQASSYGVNMLNYLDGLREQKSHNPHWNTGHKAILLGAYTTDTIHEFAVTVRDIHPDAECHVIDIEGYKTAQVSSDKAIFTKESALDLSAADNTVDSLHANNLLHMLKDPIESRQPWVNRLRLFREAHRVLRPEGVLLMVENEIDRDLIDDLEFVGFEYDIVPAKNFMRRKQMEQFLRSTADEPLPGIEIDKAHGAFIVARKPIRRPSPYAYFM